MITTTTVLPPRSGRLAAKAASGETFAANQRKRCGEKNMAKRLPLFDRQNCHGRCRDMSCNRCAWSKKRRLQRPPLCNDFFAFREIYLFSGTFSSGCCFCVQPWLRRLQRHPFPQRPRPCCSLLGGQRFSGGDLLGLELRPCRSAMQRRAPASFGLRARTLVPSEMRADLPRRITQVIELGPAHLRRGARYLDALDQRRIDRYTRSTPSPQEILRMVKFSLRPAPERAMDDALIGLHAGARTFGDNRTRTRTVPPG